MSSDQNAHGGASLLAAQGAVREFLEQALPEVRRINVTKVTKPEFDGGNWEAEAEVWQPNPTVQALHLKTQQPVLDHQHYLVRLDALLNVVAYQLDEALGD
jgi:hypothetical protein